MSGHKKATITINQEEYDRLREAELQLKALPEPKVEIITQIHQESQEGILDSLDWVAYRQNQFNELLQGFDEGLRDLEVSTSQSILDHQRYLQQELAQRDGQLWDSVLTFMDESARYFDSQIMVEHQYNQDQFSRYDQHIHQMAGDTERKIKMADQWLVSAEALCDFIRQNYHHGFFLPGQVERLHQQLNLARENLENGVPEAGLMTAQQAYTRLSEMRVELERLEAEWQVLYCSAWEGTCNLHALVNENQVVEAVDLDGAPLGIDLDVNYWTEGALTHLFADIDNLFDRLEDTTHRPVINQLREVLNQQLPALQGALEDTVFNARIAAINSQLRINIADLVVQALQEQGFSLEDASYQGVDMRQSYAARLINLEGSEVEVQVAPCGLGLGENELHLRSYDEKVRTEHELLQRWREINQSLARRGLGMRQAEVVGAGPAARETSRQANRSSSERTRKSMRG